MWKLLCIFGLKKPPKFVRVVYMCAFESHQMSLCKIRNSFVLQHSQPCIDHSLLVFLSLFCRVSIPLGRRFWESYQINLSWNGARDVNEAYSSSLGWTHCSLTGSGGNIPQEAKRSTFLKLIFDRSTRVPAVTLLDSQPLLLAFILLQVFKRITEHSKWEKPRPCPWGVCIVVRGRHRGVRTGEQRTKDCLGTIRRQVISPGTPPRPGLALGT